MNHRCIDVERGFSLDGCVIRFLIISREVNCLPLATV